MEPIMAGFVYNEDIPFEERAKRAEQQRVHLLEPLGNDHPAITRREIHIVSGCPEEPDAPEMELVIYRPTKATKRKLPVIYMIPAGGMFLCMLEVSPYWQLADKFNCVVALPRYRTAFQAPYPAAMNDCHAGYKYLVDNAETLGINADKIVLMGCSSGTNLAMSLAFRLKRYGYRPRGCVTDMSFADYRPIYATSTIRSGANWDARCEFLSGLEYLRPNNLAWAEDPEMYPIFATAEDCVGLCPMFIHVDSEEPSGASCKAFLDVLSKGGVYNELHVWGGSSHGALYNTWTFDDGSSDYVKRYSAVVDGNVTDCWKYDLRRNWILDEL